MNAPIADIGPTLDKRRAAELRARRMDKPITEAVRDAVEEWQRDAVEYLMKQTNERSAI
jgi:hypothetical protein